VFDMRSQKSLLRLNWVSGGVGVTWFEHHLIHFHQTPNHHSRPQFHYI
jgi:hypothetical protein